MGYKLRSEMGLKVACDNAHPSISSVISRPNGLINSVAVGPGLVLLNKGDTISTEMNREDVALSVCMPNEVTSEINEAGRSAPLEGKFAKV